MLSFSPTQVAGEFEDDDEDEYGSGGGDYSRGQSSYKSNSKSKSRSRSREPTADSRRSGTAYSDVSRYAQVQILWVNHVSLATRVYSRNLIMITLFLGKIKLNLLF